MKEKIGNLVYYIRRNIWRLNVRAWVSDLKSIKIDKPIFLLGTQGGGLTLVSRILRRSPALVSVTGGYKYWNGADEMQNVMAPVLPKSLRLQDREELRQFRSHGGWTYACEELYYDFREKADDITEEDAEQFRHAVRRVISMYGSKKGANRFIDKSQSYSLKMSYVNKILKNCNPYFVLITRNPYALCQRAITKTNLSKLDVKKSQKIKMAAQHWGNTMKSVMEDRKSVSRLAKFKFENIVTKKGKVIEEMCNFLDLEFREKMMPSRNDKMPITGLVDNKWYPIKERINDKYLKNINKNLVKYINKNYEEELRYTGYKKIE